MMNSRVARGLGGAVLIAVTTALLTGCAPTANRVEVTSYRDPYFPETFVMHPTTCTYRTDTGGDVHLVAQAQHTTDEQVRNEYLHVHIYWQPRLGTTWAESSTSNALLEYAVADADGLAVYRGTGFVFTERQRDGKIEANIESARLQLDRTQGDLPDFLGGAALTGHLLAKPDDYATAQTLREMELLASRTH